MNLTNNQLMALAGIVALVFFVGRKAQQAAAPVADTNIQAPQQWWNYAGSWAQ